MVMNERPLRNSISTKSLSLMGVPKKFHRVRLSDFITNDDPELNKVYDFVKDYIKNLNQYVRSCKGVFFYGSNGTGKTMLSCLLLKEAYRHRFSCRRITFSEYISKYTNIWGTKGAEKSENEDKVSIYKSAEFLIIEEIGKEIDTSIAVPILEDLMRYREDNGLTTIICTNLSPTKFREFYGNSLFSIIQGNLTPVEMVFNDHRLITYKER